MSTDNGNPFGRSWQGYREPLADEEHLRALRTGSTEDIRFGRRRLKVVWKLSNSTCNLLCPETCHCGFAPAAWE
jgi:hypothetical protein